MKLVFRENGAQDRRASRAAEAPAGRPCTRLPSPQPWLRSKGFVLGKNNTSCFRVSTTETNRNLKEEKELIPAS